MYIYYFFLLLISFVSISYPYEDNRHFRPSSSVDSRNNDLNKNHTLFREDDNMSVSSFVSYGMNSLTSNDVKSCSTKSTFAESIQDAVEVSDSELLEEIYPFLYLLSENMKEGQEKTCDLLRPYLRYNTYPFFMPIDYGLQNTLYFNTQSGHTPDDAAKRNILLLINQKFPHLIFEDFPHVESFNSLSKIGASVQSYGLHFFGNMLTCEGDNHSQSLPLGGLLEMLQSWNKEGSLAVCKHLDFAFRLSSENRLLFFNILREIILCTPSLETLSLRFMHITDEELSCIMGFFIEARSKNLRTLILSFNDLSDQILSSTGALCKLLGDTQNFPKLKMIDIKGNLTHMPSQWELLKSLRERRKVIKKGGGYLLRHGFNSFSHEKKREVRNLGALAPFEQFLHPSQFDQNDLQEMKLAFDQSSSSSLTFKNQWLVEGNKYEEHHSRYIWANMADQMLLLRHGAHQNWKTIDLRGRVIQSSCVEEDIYNGYLCLFLKHVKNKDHIKSLLLEGALSPTIGHPSRYNSLNHSQELNDCIRLFTSLTDLDLSQNHFKGMINEFGSVIEDAPHIKRFDFAGNKIGGENSIYGPTAFFFADLNILSAVKENLMYINLSQNYLNDEDLGRIFDCLSVCKCLKFCDLSSNQFTFNEVKNSTLIQQLIELIKILTDSCSALYEIDLHNNPLNFETQMSLIRTYEQIIKSKDVPWTVLRLNNNQFFEKQCSYSSDTPLTTFTAVNGRNDVHTSSFDPRHPESFSIYDSKSILIHKKPEAVSHIKGFYRTGNFLYKASQKTVTPEESVIRESEVEGVCQKSFVYLDHAHHLFIKQMVEKTMRFIQETPHIQLSFSAFTSEAQEKIYKDQAKAILSFYKISLKDGESEKIIETRARIERYIKENRKDFTKSPVKMPVSIFKSLLEREQKNRILHSLIDIQTDMAMYITFPVETQEMMTSDIKAYRSQKLEKFKTELSPSGIFERAYSKLCLLEAPLPVKGYVSFLKKNKISFEIPSFSKNTSTKK